MSDQKLITPAEFKRLTARAQGYAVYMQAELPGSRLPKRCPYPVGSPKEKAWREGEFRAMLEMQDMEE